MNHDPIPSAEEAMGWPLVGLAFLLLAVLLGMTAAFVIENWDLIAYAARDFWN
jgi:hypothetical protein